MLAHELAHTLGAGGRHRVHVLTRHAPEDDPYAVAVGGPKLLFPLSAALRYLRLGRYDLVHVHESDGVLVALALRLLRRRARLVATLQVSYVRERRSVRPVRAGDRVVSRPTGSERLFAWLRAPLHAALGRLTARLADAVVAPSRVTAAEIETDYGVPVQAVIPNGVTLPEPPADPAPDDALGVVPRADDARPPVVLYAGRMRTRKAVAVLLEAVARLRREGSELALVLAGDGEHREALERRARELGLSDATRFLGAVPRAEMTRAFRDADLFCLPSIYEGFPVAILEAMACGLPVVSTTVSGIPEAVEDGVTGILVAPEDDAALARALGRLASDPALRREMGRAGRRAVEARFAIDVVSRAYLALWQDLVGAAR